ncbi:MAG: hypothetical protein WDZ80_03765 [Candidatus Paceibacterota bacterium]
MNHKNLLLTAIIIVSLVSVSLIGSLNYLDINLAQGFSDNNLGISILSRGSFGGVVQETTNCNCLGAPGKKGLPITYGKLISVGSPKGGSFMVLNNSIFSGFIPGAGIITTKIYDFNNIKEGYWVLGSTSPLLRVSCLRGSWSRTVIGVFTGDEGFYCKKEAEGGGPVVEKIGTSGQPAPSQNGPSLQRPN